MIKVTKKYHPIRFATYDIETLGLVPINFLYGVVYYGDSHEVFLDRDSMLEEIYDRKNRGMVFFGHNCEFDLTGLTNDNIFKALDNVLYRGSHFISAQKIIYTGDKKKEYVRFWDSMRILMSSLGKIGEVLGYPKQRTPELLVNKDDKYTYEEGRVEFKQQYNTDKKYYIDYCLRDNIILYKALDQFQNFIWNKYHCGLKPTISSFYSLLENRALWYKWNAIDVKIKGLKMYEKLERINNLPRSKEVISYFKSKESLRRDKIAGSKKITDKKINPYVFDKRIYDNEIDFTVESVDTYPITINSNNETLIY